MAKLSKSQRSEIHAKFGKKCAYCGEPIELKDMQVDHVIPKSDQIYNLGKDGWKNTEIIPEFLQHLTPDQLDHPDNLFPACRVCNNWKSWHSLERFREEISMQPERMMRDNPQYRMANRYNLIQETGQEIEFWFETYTKYNFLHDYA